MVVIKLLFELFFVCFCFCSFKVQKVPSEAMINLPSLIKAQSHSRSDQQYNFQQAMQKKYHHHHQQHQNQDAHHHQTPVSPAKTRRSTSQVDQNEIDGCYTNENVTPPFKNQEKSTYGRLRVLTAPPTSVHELIASDTASPRDNDVSPFSFDANKTTSNEFRSHRNHPNVGSAGSTMLAGGGGSGTTSGGSAGGGRRSNLRPSSGTGSTQRLSSGNRDHSVTQFALIDDENVSALQQVTKGGGALTLASQWKSQFDDSEETTDNEWKQEPQVSTLKIACHFFICQINIYMCFLLFLCISF